MTPPLPSRVLVLEASTRAGAVAVLTSAGAVSRAVALGAGTDDLLWAAVMEALAEAGMRANQVEAVVCGDGPGSFTSLRIAAALAKGVAHGARCPLYAVPSLLLAATVLERPGGYLLHADAIRGERFAQAVTIDAAGVVEAQGPVQRLPWAALDAAAMGRVRVAVVASPEPDAEGVLVMPAAHRIGRLDPRLWGAPVPLATWEPAYGRLAEAQVQWEARHGIPLPAGDAAPAS